MTLSSTALICIGFGLGFVAAFVLAFCFFGSLAGEEGKAFMKARMKKGKKNGHLFEIYDTDGRARFEYIEKDDPDIPFYTSKTGVVAYDPSKIDAEAPKRYSKGLECYQFSVQTPVIFNSKNAMFTKHLITVCRRKHPELSFISDSQLLTLIYTNESELRHDCEQLIRRVDSSTDRYDEEIDEVEYDTDDQDEVRGQIEEVLDGKPKAFWAGVLGPLAEKYNNMVVKP